MGSVVAVGHIEPMYGPYPIAESTAWRAAVFALILILQGCVGDRVVTYYPWYPHYSYADFVYAGADRDMTVVVIGNPLKVEKPAFDRLVTDAMQGITPGPRTHYTTTPSADARPEYRIMMMFNSPINLPVDALCGERAKLRPEVGKKPIRLSAAFCHQDMVLSRISGRVLDLDGPDDRRLRDLVYHILSGLVPFRNPDLYDLHRPNWRR
jgi:hypothetical protein